MSLMNKTVTPSVTVADILDPDQTTQYKRWSEATLAAYGIKLIFTLKGSNLMKQQKLYTTTRDSYTVLILFGHALNGHNRGLACPDNYMNTN